MTVSSPRRRRRGALILFAVLSLLAGARGQNGEPESGVADLKKLSLSQLLDVDVTSVSRRPEKLSETASAIQVISGEEIARSGATSIPEALRLASNLQVGQVDSRQWAITARGFNNTLANKLLVLMDGRILYTPLYAGVYWDVQDSLLEDLDRIEVISGPGATQWGANAVNGVINITTKSAKETQGALVTGGIGNELHDTGGVRYGGRAGSGAYYRVYAKYSEHDRSVLPNGQGADDGWRMGQAGFRFDWDTPADDTITLQGDGYTGRIAQTGNPDIAITGNNLIGRWTRPLAENSDLRFQAYFDRTHRDIPGSIEQDLDTYDLDFQHRFPLGERQDIVWGLGYRWIQDDIRNTPTLAFLPPRVTRVWGSAFVQDAVALIPNRLDLTFGSKFEHNPYTGWETQPSVRVAWRPDSQQTLWGAISRAVRTPSRIDREFYSPAVPPFILNGGPGFRSEKLVAYELGYRVAASQALAVSIATFYNEYDDLRSVEPTNPPAQFPIVLANGLRGKSYGAELSASYRVTAHWRLRGGYTELRTKSEPKVGSFDRTSSRSQVLDPPRQLSLQSILDVTDEIGFDTTVRYVGPIANQSVPDYAEMDMRLSWRPRPQWEFALIGQNLLHAHHPEFGAPTTRREIERSIFGKVTWRY